MTERGEQRSFYLTAYTGRGFYSLAESALKEIAHLFVLRAKSCRAKTQVLEQVSKGLLERGYDVELLRSPWGDGLLEGLIAPAFDMAIVDGPVCGIDSPRGRGEVLDLDAFCDFEALSGRQQEIKDSQARADALARLGTDLLAKSLEIHDLLEVHYGQGLNFARADKAADDLVNDIFGHKPQVRDVFVAGLEILEDQYEFYRQLIASCKRRYIIKGAPGTGKSVLVRKVAEAAAERGYRVDMIHCILDPRSVDMIFIPELSVILVDGTPPHVIDPQGPKDKVIDMLQCVDWERVDELDEEAVWEKAEATTSERVRHLAEAKALRDKVEGYYGQVIDWQAVQKVAQEIVDETV